ncbi:response regulator [Roseibium aggregatum]|uniref:Response regulator n=1 Tax=Roseibium aggregatum TaxID=187304 RepID=A0A926P098_9HYPH|nr:response regulator [Roseibium aggregatum]MBD1549694.1 response regulator [Roseibium aggregatum]
MSLKALYIDDDEDIGTIAVMCLKLDGTFDARHASSGAEGIDIAVDWNPDVILLDVMMPVMDGPATRQKLKDNPATADIPVIFVTAKTQRSDLENLSGLGALGTIAKPFEPITFADDVTQLLARDG